MSNEKILIPKNKVLFDPASSVLTYVGWAPAGAATSDAVWEICRISFDANKNVTSQLWANANGNFSHVWDDRASLSYS